MITCLLHRRAFSSHASARHAGCRKVHRSRRTILRSILCRYVCYMLPVEPDNWLQVGKDAEMYVQWTLLLYAVYILYNTLELLKYADFIPMT